jgi:PAS domain S-box-containing protein
MTALIMSTPERQQYLSFTEPYLSSPYVVFIRQEDNPIFDIQGLVGKTLALPRGVVVQEHLESNYPRIKMALFDSDEEALETVATGQADAYIGNLSVASHIIHEKGLSHLKVTTATPFKEQALSMGTRSDWPELSSIINKALGSITEEEKTAIRNKYLAIKFEQGIDKAEVLKWILMVAGSASLILLLFLFWNRSLTKQVQERTSELSSSHKLLKAEIDERKQAEEKLLESRDYLKRLTDSMADAVFSVRMPERKIEWANDTFKILGYEPSECVGRTTEFLYPDREGIMDFGDKLARAVAEGKQVLHIEQMLRKKDGESFPADITISLFLQNGELVRITGIVRDISERKQKEQQLQKYQQRLKALASQLTIAEEKERRVIAADLHDYVGQSLALARMQLASASTSTSDSKLADKLDDISGTLLKSLEDTQKLMLELSSPAMHESGLSSAISEWLEFQIEERHSLKTEVIDNIPHNRRKTLDLNVRTILFRNVRELLVNVVKHARANKVSVRLEDRNTSIRIIVEDDGIGFDPGAATQAGSKTGGFGLFSIEELMTDLGGNLKIVSEPGEGCTAILSAPFSADDSQERD